jgi:hypothetical protein
LAASKAEGDAKKTLDMLTHWERLFKSMHAKAFEGTDVWGLSTIVNPALNVR